MQNINWRFTFKEQEKHSRNFVPLNLQNFNNNLSNAVRHTSCPSFQHTRCLGIMVGTYA